ncbi:MAG: hydroxyacylglutathione hydrolase [Piscirickettsiaceae bacterium]|nr:hydroxyacylglutathione hydrolase [Piscirickettsiaceae bacterium]
MINIHAISAFKDNYIWLIQAPNSQHVLIVDPGEAKPVINAIEQYQFEPAALLITHGCHDHIDGVTPLLKHYDLAVYGSNKENIPHLNHAVTENDRLLINDHFPAITVLELPGHTRGHIAFLIEDCLFCGDTLFAAGCGRIHSGTAEQLHTSLQKIAQLPKHTKIYCAHEYTQDNLRFAATVEPNNVTIQQRIKNTKHIRQKGMPSLPSDLALELASNPFLRCHHADVIRAVEKFSGQKLTTDLAVFTALRAWKDQF